MGNELKVSGEKLAMWREHAKSYSDGAFVDFRQDDLLEILDDAAALRERVAVLEAVLHEARGALMLSGGRVRLPEQKPLILACLDRIDAALSGSQSALDVVRAEARAEERAGIVAAMRPAIPAILDGGAWERSAESVGARVVETMRDFVQVTRQMLVRARSEALREAEKILRDGAARSREVANEGGNASHQYAWRLAADCEEDHADTLRDLAVKERA